MHSYLTHRNGKIRSLRWETGAVLPDRIRHDTLSARENDYFNAYNNILSSYCEDIAMDLTAEIEVGCGICVIHICYTYFLCVMCVSL